MFDSTLSAAEPMAFQRSLSLSVSPVHPAAVAATSMLQALEEFQRVCQGVSMYGADHPATIAAVEACVLACRQTREVKVVARGAKYYCDSICLTELSSLDLLCTRLTSMRVASLTIKHNIVTAELLATVEMLSSVSSGNHWTRAQAEELSQRTHGNCQIAETSYRGLEVVEGISSGAEIEIDWSHFSEDLQRVATGSGGLTATELAAAVSASLDAQILGLPAEVLESAAEALTQASPQEREAAEARLTLFFGSLSSGVRDASAQVDMSCPERSLRALQELTGAIPAATVVCGVEHVEDPKVLASPEGVKLLARLVWLSRDQDKLRGRLDKIIAQVRPLLGHDVLADTLQNALELLSECVKERELNREDYESLLSSIGNAPATVGAPRATCAGWSAQSTQIHAASIALDLALDPATPADNLESTFAHIERSISSLLEASQFAMLEDVSRAIKSNQSRNIPAVAAQAVDRCRTTLCSTPVANRIASLARTIPQETQDVPGIFARCGGTAAAGLISAILAGQIDLDPAPIINHPALNIREFISGLQKCSVQTIKTVLQLTHLTTERRGRLAHAMLSHDSPDLRVLSYRTFMDLYAQWPASLVSHAFAEDNESIVLMAFERLGDDPSNLLAAVRLLSGDLNGEPESKLFEAGVIALQRSGATSSLQEIRRRLVKRPSPTRLFRATRVFAATRRAAKEHE